MPIKILMPALSPTMTEGNLAKWLKKEGDKVAPGEVIAEIETDKATMEVEAVDEGTIGKIIVAEGSENVPVNSLIAILLEEGEDKSSVDNLINVADHLPTPQSQTANSTEVTHNTSDAISTAHSIQSDRTLASPLAKKLAQLNNIDLAKIKGSGPNGRIIKADIMGMATANERTVSAQEVPNVANSAAINYTATPHSNIRKIIAKRLLESKQTIPHFYLSIECNIDKLLNVRQEINQSLTEDKNRISINDLIILAVAKSLKETPEANASWNDNAIRYYHDIDISVAVAIDGGLITPVLKKADQKNITQLSAEMKDLVKRARENKLLPEEFQGGGFSVSNLGMYGIKNFQAIINPPQSCILAVGGSSKRAVVINEQLSIANILDVSLSCDHRVVDGVIGAKFLSSLKKYIEKPLLIIANIN